MLSNVKVGDVLLLAEKRVYGDKSWRFSGATVVKIGRTWVSLQLYRNTIIRADIRTGRVEHHQDSQARAFVDREQFELETAADATWHAIRKAVNATYHRPSSADARLIERAAVLLGIDIHAEKRK